MNDQGINSTIEDNVVFEEKLSNYGLFQGKMGDLIPNNDAEKFELASTLFTDYADKQRIILLPKGQKIKAVDNGLLDFPEGTIIAKTFFYSPLLSSRGEGIFLLETRLLIKNKSQWNAATYQWNAEQDEAFLLIDGATIPVSFVDDNGNDRTTNYKIPSKMDCISCHRHSNQLLPIGPKLRNMNIVVNREGKEVNQLEYLQNKKKLDIMLVESVQESIDYRNINLPLAKRARMYLDINCAHCHNPNGIAYMTQLDLRNETAIHETGIWFKQGKIAHRITVQGELHMPKIGTTIPDKRGVKLILDYLQNLED